ALLQEERLQQHDVERRGRLEEDRAGGGGELVGLDEQYDGDRVGDADERGPRGQAAANGGNEQHDGEGGDRSPEAGHLPARERAGLDGGACGGKERGPGHELQAVAGLRGHAGGEQLVWRRTPITSRCWAAWLPASG